MTAMFFKGSRYERVGEVEMASPDGRMVRFKRIRFIGAPAPRWTHAVRDADRLDRLAHRFYRDPERFWLISDANRALWPPDLLDEIGRVLDVPGAEERPS
jgi:hypothetical protein